MAAAAAAAVAVVVTKITQVQNTAGLMVGADMVEMSAPIACRVTKYRQHEQTTWVVTLKNATKNDGVGS